MRKTPFNMIEVLLALGVIAIGAVSIMALFPYGFASSRDSVAESFAGDSADQFLHWFAAQVHTSTGWTTYASDATWLPITKPADPVPPPPAGAGTGMETQTGTWGASQSITPNLLYQRHSADAGVLKVTFQRGNSAQPIVDFSAVYRTWRESVTQPYLRNDGTAATSPLSTDSALAINLEASWPAELPYQRRQKAVYRLEVFKPGT
jgi:type II secretory pathway pseudopilin PulG